MDEPERLAYVLNLEGAYGAAGSARPGVTVYFHVVRRLANGEYGGGTPYLAERILNASVADACVRPADIAIVRRLKLAQPQGHFYNWNILSGAEGASLLEEMVRTGRCHWRGTTKKHPVLAIGPPRLAKLEWHSDKQGMQSPGFDVTPKPTAILPLVPPWYVDQATATCGPLDTGLPPAVAHAWYNAPTLKPDQAELLGEELVRRYPELQIPAPRRIEVETVTDLKPTPCLRLYSHPIVQQNYGYYYSSRTREPDKLELNLARLEFDYGGQRVAYGAPGNLIEQLRTRNSAASNAS